MKDVGNYSEIAAKYPGLKVTTYKNRIITPGFIDGNIHVGQTRVLGAYGEQLLPWLLQWIFPEEIKFKDPAYAREAINHYFENLLASGTTTVQDFGTGFESATEIYFDEASK
ncbi:MAG TPA: amidohydrolase family protein, partial [Candidatus Obscuribacterales bacterium]